MIREKPIVSIIINCFNSERFLEQAIKSVFSQEFENWEIIIWDNLSQDSTGKLALKFDNEKVKYFKSKEHTNLGEARNLAMREVKGDYIAFLDSDDTYEPKYLSTVIELINSNNTDCIYVKANKIIFNKKSQVSDDSHELKTISFKNLFINYNIFMSGTLVKKKAIDQHKLNFDSILNHAEDYDFFLSLSKLGKIHFYDRTLINYRIHDNNVTKINARRGVLEEEYVMTKITLRYPKFYNKNKNIFLNKKKKFQWNYFLFYCLESQGKIARKNLSGHKYNSLKYFTFFLLSYISTRIVVYFWKKNNAKKNSTTFTKIFEDIS
tara:strand:- start:98 stop:1063 length:966 start_codon:yes stop_codon:yes gene_type:complete